MFSCETCEIFNLRAFILKNTCKRLLLTTSTFPKKLSISFTKLCFHNYYYNLWGFLVSFALLCSHSFCQFILQKYFFLLCYLSSSELIDYHVETFFSKIAHTWKIIEQYAFTQKLPHKNFQIGRTMQFENYSNRQKHNCNKPLPWDFLVLFWLLLEKANFSFSNFRTLTETFETNILIYSDDINKSK